MRLTLQDLINNGLLDELANCLHDHTNVTLLLTRIGFPAGARPNFRRAPSPLAYWLEVCEKIESGTVVGGFEPLLSAAANQLPGNSKFAPFVARATKSQASPSYLQRLDNGYHVFLSFSSEDRTEVTEIARELRKRGLNPWLDEWALSPGQQLVKEMEEILDRIKVVAACVGQSGHGPWQQAEVDIAIERSLRGQCLLIPVMLLGVTPEDLSPFLRRLSGVRMPDIEALADVIRSACQLNRGRI